MFNYLEIVRLRDARIDSTIDAFIDSFTKIRKKKTWKIKESIPRGKTKVHFRVI